MCFLWIYVYLDKFLSMKLIFSIIAFCVFSLGFSQTAWTDIDQSYFNMKYKLPDSWEVDGFGSGFGSWDEDGSSVCECSGTINFGPGRKLGMVVYPTSVKTDPKRRENIWYYHFVPNSETSVYISKKLKFKKTISKWEQNDDVIRDDDDMMNDEVWRFELKNGRFGFIIYFWGDSSVMASNEKTIYEILDSLVPIKK